MRVWIEQNPAAPSVKQNWQYVSGFLLFMHWEFPKTQSEINHFTFEVHILGFFFLPSAGAGKRSVHIKQPTWGNPDHAQQWCDP